MVCVINARNSALLNPASPKNSTRRLLTALDLGVS
jgi:hypothetical protein